MESHPLDSNPGSTTYYVMGKLFGILVPQFPHLKWGKYKHLPHSVVVRIICKNIHNGLSNYYLKGSFLPPLPSVLSQIN